MCLNWCVRETRVSSEQNFESAHDSKLIVLFAGLAAGLGCGLLVAYEHLKKYKAIHGDFSIDIEGLLIDVLGPSATSGLLLAVLVGTGAIVFIFEEVVASTIGELNDMAEEVKKAAPLIQSGARMLGDESTTLSNLLYTMRTLDKRDPSATPELRNAESYYVRGCYETMAFTSEFDQVRAAKQRIMAAYWYEEASDIRRLSMVTNPRNYTNFLIAAVTALKEQLPQDSKVHFYTTTPAGPHSLMNWPEEGVDKQGGDGAYFLENPFISAYLLFVRELVSDSEIVHRRWIWSKNTSEKNYLHAKKFARWKHYQPRPSDLDKVIAVPIDTGLLTSTHIEKLKLFLGYRGCASTPEHIGQWFQEQTDAWNEATPLNQRSVAVQPVLQLDDGADSSIWVKLVVDARKLYCSRLKSSFLEISNVLATLDADLKNDLIEFERLKEVLDEQEKWKLNPTSKWFFLLQRLDAAIMVYQKTDDAGSRGAICDRLVALTQDLVRLRWCDFWLDQSEKEQKPQSLNSYISRAFHTDGEGPYYLTPEDLPQRGKDELEHPLLGIGPEFAILGIEVASANTSSSGPKYVTELGNGKQVHWMLGLKSTIASPWVAGHIEIITQQNKTSFNSLWQAITYLTDRKRK